MTPRSDHLLRFVEGYEWQFCFATEDAPHPGPIYWTQIHSYTVTVYRRRESKKWAWHFKIDHKRGLLYQSVVDSNYHTSEDAYDIIRTAEERLYKVLAA